MIETIYEFVQSDVGKFIFTYVPLSAATGVVAYTIRNYKKLNSNYEEGNLERTIEVNNQGGN